MKLREPEGPVQEHKCSNYQETGPRRDDGLDSTRPSEVSSLPLNCGVFGRISCDISHLSPPCTPTGPPGWCLIPEATEGHSLPQKSPLLWSRNGQEKMREPFRWLWLPGWGGKDRVIGEDRCIYGASYLYDKISTGHRDAIRKKTTTVKIWFQSVGLSASDGQLDPPLEGSPCNPEILCCVRAWWHAAEKSWWSCWEQFSDPPGSSPLLPNSASQMWASPSHSRTITALHNFSLSIPGSRSVGDLSHQDLWRGEMGIRQTASGRAQEDLLWALTSQEGRYGTAWNRNKLPKHTKSNGKKDRKKKLREIAKNKKEFQFYLFYNTNNICNTLIHV